MLEATPEELAMFDAVLDARARTPWPECNLLPPLDPAAYPFRGYTVHVTWQDGWLCRWHTDSIPDVTLLEEQRPGVLYWHYSAD
jgi:hypothetical protein